MNEFLEHGFYGFYSKFFLEVVYLHHKKTSSIINIFTKVTAIEKISSEFPELNLKFGALNNYYNFGYKSTIKPKEFIYSILSNIPDRYFKDNEFQIQLSNLIRLKKQYVSNLKNRPLNSLFKCCNGHYVFEFFDEEKEYVQFILDDFNLFNKLNENLAITKLDLSKIPERLGNIIIDLPNGLIIDTSRINGTDLKITWDPRIDTKINGMYILTRDSKTMLDLEQFTFSNNEIIFTEQTYQQNFQLFDLNRNIILLDGHNCKEYLVASLSLTKQLDKLRTFKDGSHPIEIWQYLGSQSIGDIEFNPDRIVNRYREKLKVITNENELVYKQYGTDTTQSNRKEKEGQAISDLIKLIEKFGSKGIWIWDPYISAKENVDLIVKKHLYTSEVKILGSMKIYSSNNLISGLNLTETDETKKTRWIKQNKDILENGSNNFGLNLEFRIAHSDFSSKFHDRFIIFPSVGIYNQPKVWSLGISLNQFGLEHHILHQVGFPEYIIKAFNNYWNRFDKDENLVFKSVYDE
jgi:hypothetical protein